MPVEIDNYRTIRLATTLATKVEDPETTMSFLNDGMNVNRMTEQNTYMHLYNQVGNGGIESISNPSAAKHICDAGALAQSMHILNNPPPHHIMNDLRNKVDNIQHPAGPTHTEYADMQVHCRSSTAASAQVYNNNLELSEYIPSSMSEEDMMQQAMVASTSVGGSIPITSTAAELSAYVPPNMSNEEMYWRGIAESCRVDPMSMSQSLVEPRSGSSNRSDINVEDVGRCQLSLVLQLPPHNSLLPRIHVLPLAIQYQCWIVASGMANNGRRYFLC